MPRRRREARGRIVVDASVARSCGHAGSSGQALSCFEALAAIEAGQLMVGMSAGIYDEWARHWSTYGRKWLVKMTSSRRVYRCTPKARTDILRLIRAVKDNGIKLLLLKDMILVEAALSTDRQVVSCDDKARH